MELYTDGGCRDNGQSSTAAGGIGIVILNQGEENFFSQTTYFKPNTNNKTEIFAVIKGLQLLKDFTDTKNFVKDKLTIYSDSNYTIQGITNWINGWRANGWKTANHQEVKNKELWMKLDDEVEIAKEYYDITFVKVKGHAGNKYNEKCDQLANEAMDKFKKEDSGLWQV